MTLLRRLLLVLAAVAAVWSAAVVATGGLVLRLGGRELSSRRADPFLAIGAVAALASWAIFRRSRPRPSAQAEWAWWRQQLRQITLPRLALAGGLFLCAYQYLWLAVAPLWLDEEMIAINIRDRSFADLTGGLWLGQSAPYGWLALQRAVLLALGQSEMALRLVPTLFGIALIIVAYRVGRGWLRPIGATVLVLLCTWNVHISRTLIELKHYSADLCLALLLPALAVWAADMADARRRARRALVFWITAAAGLWFANGASLVMPASVAILLGFTWRRHGLQAAMSASLPGLVALASFGLNYLISARYTLASPFLRSVWAPELPPAGIGFFGFLDWTAHRLAPLAMVPGGTDLWIHLWGLAALGVVIGRPRALAIVCGLIPISAFVVAGLGIVPLFERFSFWIVPALYVGVALAVDRIVEATRHAVHNRRWAPVALGVIMLVLATQVSIDIIRRGWVDMTRLRNPETKHMLDDRAAAGWLMARRQPGDAIITTHLSWPAVWWYGKVPLNTVQATTPSADVWMLEAGHESAPELCAKGPVSAVLKNHQRAVVYFGFGDVPDGFESLLMQELDRIGTLTAWADFGAEGRVVIFDLHGQNAEQLTLNLLPRPGVTATPLGGCVVVQPVRPW